MSNFGFDVLLHHLSSYYTNRLAFRTVQLLEHDRFVVVRIFYALSLTHIKDVLSSCAKQCDRGEFIHCGAINHCWKSTVECVLVLSSGVGQHPVVMLVWCERMH